MARITLASLPSTLFTILLVVLLASPASAVTNGTYTKPPVTPAPTATASTTGTIPTSTHVTAGVARPYSGGAGNSVLAFVVTALFLIVLGFGF